MEVIGRHKYELDTPCYLIDADKLEHNLRAMQEYVQGEGKNLCPYAKTHKCSEITRKHIKRGAVEVCTAKLAEADVLLDIDPGLHRSGVAVTEALDTGSMLMELRNLNLMGIQAYAGQVQHVLSYAER